jgi:hypothetical protein
VRVLRAVVDLQLAKHRAAQRVLREHALDGLLDDERRALVEEPIVASLGQAARVAGVAVRDLLGLLAAGEPDAAGVDHDHVVAGVGVGCVDGLVLALEDGGDLRREAPEYHVVGVDDVPTALDVARLGSVGLHA